MQLLKKEQVLEAWERGMEEDCVIDKEHIFDDFGIDYFEYECPCACTENGCLGHHTNIPIAIYFGGVAFFVGGYESGDFPSSNMKEIEQVKNAVEALQELIENRK